MAIQARITDGKLDLYVLHRPTKPREGMRQVETLNGYASSFRGMQISTELAMEAVKTRKLKRAFWHPDAHLTQADRALMFQALADWLSGRLQPLYE